MNRLMILMACACFLAMNYHVNAQDKLKQEEDKYSKRDARAYILNSIDGRKCRVSVLPRYPLEVLKICYQEDTVIIGDYWGAGDKITIITI